MCEQFWKTKSTSMELVGRPIRKHFRVDDLFSDASNASDLETVETIPPELLQERARWIRDDLDTGIAVDGPSYLNADQVVILFTFLTQLRRARIPVEDIRLSRIHLAVLCMSSRATRWPGSLIDEADKLLENWTVRYGPLDDIGVLLYEEGGRLHGIAAPTDLNIDVLQVKWLRAKDSRVQSCYALQSGDLGFKPGDWWINTMFAYQSGILENGKSRSRIVADRRGAYALLLAGDDELNSPDPSHFTYRANDTDVGRYRLTAATPASREPVRVLRSHTLRSFWAPRAGVRYDGLYRVTGWRILPVLPKSKTTTNKSHSSSPHTAHDRPHSWRYDIDFARLSSETTPMSQVLRRPRADELDDYKEYKRIRHYMRESRGAFGRAKPLLLLGRDAGEGVEEAVVRG